MTSLENSKFPPPKDITEGWKEDPTGRFEHRWWDGSKWTSKAAKRKEAIASNDSSAVAPPTPKTSSVGAPKRSGMSAQPRRQYNKEEEIEEDNDYKEEQKPKKQNQKVKNVQEKSPSNFENKLQNFWNFLVGLDRMKQIAIFLVIILVGFLVLHFTNKGSSQSASNPNTSTIGTTTTQLNALSHTFLGTGAQESGPVFNAFEKLTQQSDASFEVSDSSVSSIAVAGNLDLNTLNWSGKITGSFSQNNASTNVSGTIGGFGTNIRINIDSLEISGISQNAISTSNLTGNNLAFIQTVGGYISPNLIITTALQKGLLYSQSGNQYIANVSANQTNTAQQGQENLVAQGKIIVTVSPKFGISSIKITATNNSTYILNITNTGPQYTPSPIT